MSCVSVTYAHKNKVKQPKLNHSTSQSLFYAITVIAHVIGPLLTMFGWYTVNSL